MHRPAYRDYILNELPRHEFLGAQIATQLHYYPAATREDFAFAGRDQRGRLTELLDSGRMPGTWNRAAGRHPRPAP